MKILIPERWRQEVATILRASRRGTIIATTWAKSRWKNLDDAHYEAGLYALLAEQLSIEGDLYGKHELNMDEEGECYSFTFDYEPPSANAPVELYTKLNLLPDGQVVIIYSAHT